MAYSFYVPLLLLRAIINPISNGDEKVSHLHSSTKKHRLTILVLEGFIPFDVSVPYNIFSQVKLQNGRNPYDVSICGHKAISTSHEWQITGSKTLADLAQANTIIIPGLDNPLSFNDQQVLKALQQAADSGTRIASICTGACVLAASGLLDGLRATTHWDTVEALAQTYPQIKVEPDILFTDNGQILTSAGLASGIDLCLHMIRKDYGAAVAEKSAQFFVMPLEREGNHHQCIRRNQPQADDTLTPILYWLLDNLHLNHTLQSIALQAHMSARTLNRKFKEQMGIAPITWVTTARIRRAQVWLESTTLSIEQIATTTGFNSATAFREQFKKTVGIAPTAWRKTYKTDSAKHNSSDQY